MGGAVEEIRRLDHRALVDEGDNRLARTKYMRLYGQEEVPRKVLG
nr:hypothetical protein [Geomesophilobacter sediminis]